MEKERFMYGMAGLLLAIFSSSCKDEYSLLKEKIELIIHTNLDPSRAGGEPQNLFITGDRMGLFLFDEEDNSVPYLESNSYLNVPAEYIVDSWYLDEYVHLVPKNARVGAIYPYSESITDYSRIPIRLNNNSKDFMYVVPTYTNSVSKSSPECFLHFKHALACLTFLVKVEDTGTMFTSLELSDYAGSKNNYMRNNGTLNAYTGEINNLSGSSLSVMFTMSFSNEFPSLDSDKAINMFVFPTDHIEVSPSDRLNFYLRVRGSSYNTFFSDDLIWEAGKRYIYYVTLKGTRVYISRNEE